MCVLKCLGYVAIDVDIYPRIWSLHVKEKEEEVEEKEGQNTEDMVCRNCHSFMSEKWMDLVDSTVATAGSGGRHHSDPIGMVEIKLIPVWVIFSSFSLPQYFFFFFCSYSSWGRSDCITPFGSSYSSHLTIMAAAAGWKKTCGWPHLKGNPITLSRLRLLLFLPGLLWCSNPKLLWSR